MVKIEINFKQIERAVNDLSIQDRTKLLERLTRTTRKNRFEKLRSSIRAKVKKHPISQKELNAIVEEAREEFHAQDRR